MATDAKLPARKLWLASRLPEECLQDLHLGPDPDPAVNSSFKLGTVAQTAIGIAGLSAAHFHVLRGGEKQSVSVDPRHALIEFKSEAYYLINGELPEGELFVDLSGLYQTRDNGFVCIHTNFPHHKQGVLDILQCEPTRSSVQAALLEWDAQKYEDVAAEKNMCATKFRSFQEWDRHPQAVALQKVPPRYSVCELECVWIGGSMEESSRTSFQFDSLVQNATGFGCAEADAYSKFTGDASATLRPRPLPCQALDHAAGYLLAFGINAALCKTLSEGGSWEVRVSLAAVAQWIRSMGQLDPQNVFSNSRPLPPRTSPPADEIASLSVELLRMNPETRLGNEDKDDSRARVSAVRHAADLSLTPAKEYEAPLILDAHMPRWVTLGRNDSRSKTCY